jgi:hypothetical protein
MAVPGEKSFSVLEYHTSKSVVTVQPALRAKCRLGVGASRNQVVARYPLKVTLNGFGPVFCIVRRNQQELQLRSYRCRKQQCGRFYVSVWCFLVINVCNHGEHYETPCIHLHGVRSVAAGWGTALKAGRSRVRFHIVSLEFFIEINLSAALWPWGWLSL